MNFQGCSYGGEMVLDDLRILADSPLLRLSVCNTTCQEVESKLIPGPVQGANLKLCFLKV